MRGGGAEKVALRLIGDFVAAGHQVDLVLMEKRGELLEKLPPAVRIFNLGARRIRDSIFPLRAYLRRERPAALQASMWPLTVAAVVARRLAGASSRLVLSDHSTLSRQYGDYRGLKRLFLRASLQLFYPRADARVIVSNGSADDLARLAGIGRSSIEVIHNPVAAPADTEIPASVEGLWGKSEARILTVGSLKAEKNHKLLIHAFALLREKRPARLIIVGEGSERPELERLIGEFGLRDDVLLPGFAVNPSPYYATADLFVLSSDFEGFGLVLVEAMRAGLKVVSTDCEHGPSEILGGGIHGALVPCGDPDALCAAMVAALDAPADVASLKDQAERISGSASSARYLELMLGSAA
jgi:glycosyltransferase involved in cell wall biosynthesis